MNPSATSPVPAKDAMGMDYEPVYAEDNASRQPKILFYRNPMNPSVTSPIPAKDNMGMDYLPVYAEDEAKIDDLAGAVRIDAATVQNIGVRTALAQKTLLTHVVRAVGRVPTTKSISSACIPKPKAGLKPCVPIRPGKESGRMKSY
ncbi:hypothetical protein [Methylomonas koyamae]|uniref:hypothetical protein n=1 Tax=Methylomonas koyamae TaxID=702114 RepID=UPI000B3349A4|nr:hypothetical protein [Methylomonas koyamae]